MKNWPEGAVDGLYPHGGDRTDLRGIIRYTGKEWGAAQVRRYIARLEQGIVNLAAGRGPFRDMSDLFPKLRMMRCECHYIVCLARENAPALFYRFTSFGPECEPWPGSHMQSRRFDTCVCHPGPSAR